MKKFEVTLRKNGEVTYSEILEALDMCMVIDSVTCNESTSFDEIEVKEIKNAL